MGNENLPEITKKCNDCKIHKFLSEFHNRARSLDGKAYVCKVCKADYDKSPEQRSRRDRYDRSERGLSAHNKAKLKWRNNNTIKQNALDLVRKAVSNGEIIKLESCEQCDTKGRVEGHHHDYAKPLEVEWLCSQCHRDWHCEHGEALNAKNE